jgi:hypothetical protein
MLTDSEILSLWRDVIDDRRPVDREAIARALDELRDAHDALTGLWERVQSKPLPAEYARACDVRADIDAAITDRENPITDETILSASPRYAS